ncbi:uncharacterized protein LOC128157314 [Crassostrea angulata]|uniref:uncharacterized protein LOC128157314 n=1 Tax=Magallana angulata TaxID=2784310 RepID=UPI0022B2187C|nr:uncharacterized protein LOC128157314 [Crassostrea angulata]
MKITGDNVDVYVRTSSLNRERRNKDLHLFASNIIFSRIATIDMPNTPPGTNVEQLKSEHLLMTGMEKAKFLSACSVLLARILCKIPAFENLKRQIPVHIPHEYSQKMSTRSEVFPLPIMFCNESKHEDCMGIMDSYENQLTRLFENAFGNIDALRRYGVPVGGDQLTRVRLQEAKNIRSLAVTPERRYDDLHPIVCEMWHSKQDFLEKCYKKFFGEKHSSSQGTLAHFKTILHRTDVNGKVKGRFKPHFELLMLVGECMVQEQFLEFLNMESFDSQPTHPMTKDVDDPENQRDNLMKLIQEFMKHYGYGQVDCPTPKKDEADKICIITREGQNIQIELVPTNKQSDELYNYSVQLCQWYLHLNELHDTAKEGDLNRTILNCQYSLPFFFSHSKLSKYLVENIDYVLKCKYLLSPLQRMRVLEGSYVNINGGQGQNVESDLTQEHSVCNQKMLIKSLGANKSENAIKRVTGAAETISNICEKFDESLNIKPKSGSHSRPLNESDQKLVSRTLRRLRPFRFTPGRKCPGFSNIDSVPVTFEKLPDMHARINQIISRLTKGLHVNIDENDNDSEVE